MGKRQKAMFRVSFYHYRRDNEPIAVIPIEAKMPLGAMAMALVRLSLTTAMECVVVESEELQVQEQYFNVRIEEGKLAYQVIKKTTE